MTSCWLLDRDGDSEKVNIGRLLPNIESCISSAWLPFLPPRRGITSHYWRYSLKSRVWKSIASTRLKRRAFQIISRPHFPRTLPDKYSQPCYMAPCLDIQWMRPWKQENLNSNACRQSNTLIRDWNRDYSYLLDGALSPPGVRGKMKDEFPCGDYLV